MSKIEFKNVANMLYEFQHAYGDAIKTCVASNRLSYKDMISYFRQKYNTVASYVKLLENHEPLPKEVISRLYHHTGTAIKGEDDISKYPKLIKEHAYAYVQCLLDTFSSDTFKVSYDEITGDTYIHNEYEVTQAQFERLQRQSNVRNLIKL
jgi:hypothetical protein